MEDLSAFATAHPEFCDSKAVRLPGHAAVPSLDGARPFELTADALSAYRVDVPKDPATLPNMLKMGPEAVAFYVSFRLLPERWGIYVREGALRALKEEYHRIIWRDLGKYADRNVDDVAEKVETTLVLDYLLAHNRIHFLVERAVAAAARLEGLREVPQPQDVGRRDELRAHSVFVQPGDVGTRAGRVEPASLGRIGGHPEPVQGLGARLPERVPPVNRLPASDAGLIFLSRLRLPRIWRCRASRTGDGPCTLR